MIVAWCHPLIEAAWEWVDSLSIGVRTAVRAVVLAAVAAAGHAWYQRVYTLNKADYNVMHPYTSWVPITLWIVVRNLTPGLRSHSLALFGWLGCITLETYLSQFHIWLRSNVPDGQPKWVLDLVRHCKLFACQLAFSLHNAQILRRCGSGVPESPHCQCRCDAGRT
jgi:N-acetylneuraminate 9-O-acetyltransferase